jgi:hypothetical protein
LGALPLGGTFINALRPTNGETVSSVNADEWRGIMSAFSSCGHAAELAQVRVVPAADMSPHGLWTAVCQERSLRRYFASFAAMRSASMIVVTLVATDGISGMMDASTTCRLLTPRTLPHASTTAVGSESPPIGTVEVGWR